MTETPKINNGLSKYYEIIYKHKLFFHNHPEYGFNEYETGRYIEKVLRESNIDIRKNVAKSGIVGVIYGADRENCIAIRCDMDALIIGENECKHVCGHDAHMAICLTLAEVLAVNRDNLKKSVKFIFQPAEELCNGAKMMIQEKVLESPKVQKIYGIHMWSDLKVGEISISERSNMSGGGQFYITVHGKTSHGALPDKGTDAILISALIIEQIQAIISRNISPVESAVVTVGQIRGGISDNRIANLVKMSGTVRYFDESIRDNIINKMKSICSGIEKAWDCKIEFKYFERVMLMKNSKKVAAQAREIAQSIFGSNNIKTDFKTMCVDDFSEYLNHVDGVYMLVGCRNGNYYPQHHPLYYVDDAALQFGINILYGICKKELF